MVGWIGYDRCWRLAISWAEEDGYSDMSVGDTAEVFRVTAM